MFSRMKSFEVDITSRTFSKWLVAVMITLHAVICEIISHKNSVKNHSVISCRNDLLSKLCDSTQRGHAGGISKSHEQRRYDMHAQPLLL